MRESTPAADLPRPEARHLRGLTGLRGVAAWWVVLYHFREYFPSGTPAWLLALCGQGYLAVDLFFVLSGFIIAYNYLPLFLNFRRSTYSWFLGIRLARIYPLHLFILILFLLNPIIITLMATQPVDAARYNVSYYLMSLFLIQNWGFTDNLAWNVPAWSISVEWMAYLLFPLIAWPGNKKLDSILYTVVGLTAPLILLGLILSISNVSLGGDIAKGGLVRCLCEFASGIFVYRLWVLRKQNGLITIAVGSALVVAAILYIATDISIVWLVPAIWAGMVFLLATGQKKFGIVFGNRFLEVVGLWSYSTYLIHYFVRDWIKFLLVRDGIPASIQLMCYVCATAVASWLLYDYIEVPGRRSLRRFVEKSIPIGAS